MKKKVRTLEFYGFDDDNTMYDVNPYVISDTKEIKNKKYLRPDEEEPTEDSGSIETNA
jgi:hypothetical protein